MKEQLFQALVSQRGALSVTEIVFTFTAALILSGVIFISYRFSHAGSVYSAKFNISLVMLTLTTTLVMNVISNNLALSLGMVGALSIVRFRTAIKDSRDTAYIFWCIAVGICCGAEDFLMAGIGTGVIFLVMLFLGNVRNNDRYLLVIRGLQCMDAVSRTVDEYYNHEAFFRVDNSDRDSMELIYEVSEGARKKAETKHEGTDIKTALFAIKEVSSVNLVCQNDEITR